MNTKMEIDAKPPVTYADILKNILPRKRYHSECPEKTWFEQVEEFDRNKLAERSISLSNIRNDNKLIGYKTEPQSPVSSQNSCTTSNESLDQKMSSDFDSCLDTLDASSEEKFDKIVRNRGIKRRFSVDSHRTSSSSGCSLSTDNSKSRTNSSSDEFLFETDAAVLARRQKQIDYGKRTRGYECYLNEVPRLHRKPYDLQTPNKHLKYSRRAFDGLIRVWRKRLHNFDPKDSADVTDIEQEKCKLELATDLELQTNKIELD